MVFLDTFSGWMEAFPTRHETSKTVTKNLLEDIIPRHGIPIFLSSDDGPAFVSWITQFLVRATEEELEITLCLQTSEFRSGRMNEQNPKRDPY